MTGDRIDPGASSRVPATHHHGDDEIEGYEAAAGAAPVPDQRREVGGVGIDPLLMREKARHHSEWRATCDELPALSGAPANVLVERLEQDLSAVATAAIHALTAVRESSAFGEGEPTSGDLSEIGDAAGSWLATITSSLRSALVAHMALGVVRPEDRPSQDE
ncbi:hypothetical protein WIS52_20535 [Pseudonocardia nematodicida]|uniref:Uncharacterized protein n=1 Tax=Pseudonocardia nematodicida TaxID=1206997 RepID=A0ABV1KGY5_9PSEU